MMPMPFSRPAGCITALMEVEMLARKCVKIVKLRGDFIWHDHKNTDETFIVLEGTLRIDFRDGAVHVLAGEMFIVPKGVEHKPYAEHEVRLLLIEPRGVLNTGHEGGERTAENDVSI